MISFRYHVVSLSAVLLALAAGVLLGSGLLSKEVSPTTTSASPEKLVSPVIVGYDTGYTALTSPALLKDTLSGRTVLVASLPGARDAEIEGVVENLGRAGARVSGRIVLTDKLLSSGNRQFAEGVAEQSNPDGASTANPWDSIGTAIARGWLTKSDGKIDQVARTVQAAFTEGGLVQNVDEPSARAELVVIVAGPATGGHGAVLAEILPSVVDSVRGVLVAGPVAAGDGGVVQDVRDSDAGSLVSTFDVLDVASGRVGAVLALVEASDGQPGSWGTTRSADGPLPR